MIAAVVLPSGLFWALLVFAAIGVGCVCSVIVDIGPPTDAADRLWAEADTEDEVLPRANVTVLRPAPFNRETEPTR
jgi:hypothetical protein